jgi:hypothetical protein
MELKPVVKWIVILISLTGCVGVAASDPEAFQGVLGEALSNQVSQFTMAFTIAAWVHSGRVKKEIRTQVGGIISSIDSVAQTLKQDLAAQGKRLDGVENTVKTLANRVEGLEKQSPK